LKQHLWKDQALCLGFDTNIFFDTYEENLESRNKVDKTCSLCPVKKLCFANGISGKEWGVWGGIYLENGEISKEFNNHKTKKDWSNSWQSLTMEQ
jgi:signal transduction histidine kinase